MKLWRRASGALKDQNSIWIASLARRTKLRNPELEVAVVKATSHHESHVDYKSAQRVLGWVRTSPACLRPLVWALCVRMEKTRCWTVALKGLMLMHALFCSKVPAVHMIGRLPFDLSAFRDAHLAPAQAWPYNAFVRAYYAFLDHKSSLLCIEFQERRARRKDADSDQPPSMMQELLRLQKLQGLLDMSLQVRPQAGGMSMDLLLVALDCIIVEVFDIYSRICDGIAGVLVRIYSARRVEAAMALAVLQKATRQVEDLSSYLEFCKEVGLLSASECPRVERIPEEDIRELELIINGVSDNAVQRESKLHLTSRFGESAATPSGGEGRDSKRGLKTIITQKWEVFDEDLIQIDGDDNTGQGGAVTTEDPFAASLKFPPHHVHSNHHPTLPDLICF